jgi:NAD(P)-dependent dehydrogenase (short-subunit alcohol dehydrogenase family)
VVTGATSGIGKAAAKALARLGAHVVLVGRDRGRAEAAAAEIAAAGTPPSVEIADLASMEQVRALAGRLAGLERIDVLINNAGLVPGHRPARPTTAPVARCPSSHRPAPAEGASTAITPAPSHPALQTR